MMELLEYKWFFHFASSFRHTKDMGTKEKKRERERERESARSKSPLDYSSTYVASCAIPVTSRRRQTEFSLVRAVAKQNFLDEIAS
jgi:hypothetical protein